MNKELIKKLRNKEIFLRGEGDYEDIKKILREAFPKDKVLPPKDCRHTPYYTASVAFDGEWSWNTYHRIDKNLPIIGVRDFFKEKEEIMEQKKKVIRKQSYNIEVEVFDDGTSHVTRTVKGMTAPEILGHLEVIKDSILRQLSGEMETTLNFIKE